MKEQTYKKCRFFNESKSSYLAKLKNHFFSQLRDVIHKNLAYLESHESPLNTAGGAQRGWLELSGGDFSSTPPSRLPASKPILFNRCWTSHLKRLGFQSPPPTINRIQTEITTGFLFCVLVFALRKPRMVCPLFCHQEQGKRWERETERKNWRARRQLLVFRPICDIGLWTESDLYSFLSPSAHRPLRLRGQKGGQTSSRFIRVSNGSFGCFKCSETLRVSSPFLSKSLSRHFSIAAKRRKCIHVWQRKANRFRGLSWRSSAFPLLVVSSCFHRLYGGPACK